MAVGDSTNTRAIPKYNSLQKIIDDDDFIAADIPQEFVTGYKGLYNRCFKRVIDFIFAMVIVVCVFPILLVVSVAIIAEDGFPILYRGERGGYHGKAFTICKFRSMIKNADEVGGGTTSLHDCRITKVGTIIRKLKVDELPNLFNVIKGDMGFIGPRPELLCYTNQYTGAEKLILEVRPGMTDYSSIEFINLDEIVGDNNADEMYEKYVLPRKNKLRIKYAATVSITTDIELFISTIKEVLGKAVAFIIKREHR